MLPPPYHCRLLQYFETKIQAIAQSNGMASMFWEASEQLTGRHSIALRHPVSTAHCATPCSNSPPASLNPPFPHPQEVFDKNYSMLESSIVDVWLSYDEVQAAIAAQHRVVISYGLYLDQQNPVGAKHYFCACVSRGDVAGCIEGILHASSANSPPRSLQGPIHG